MGSCIVILMKKLIFILLIGLSLNIQAESNSACIHTYTHNKYIHVAEISLTCPNLRIIGSTPQDKGTTVSEFAAKHGTDIAINANFFKKDFTPLGLTITDSKRWEHTRDTRSRTIFACTHRNKCVIEALNKVSQPDPNWSMVISGWQYFNRHSAKFECASQDKIGCTQDIFVGKHPRTMLGLNEAKNILYFVMVEGRMLGFQGVTLDELALLAMRLGLTKAINLDGGGSSTFVVQTERISKLPLLQMSERKVSNHLGVKLLGN